MGINGPIIFERGVCEIPDATNSVIPTGGVLIPIARFAVTTNPKCTGLIPRIFATGSKIGTIRIIAGVESKIMPRNNKITLEIKKKMILLLHNANNASVIAVIIWLAVNTHDNAFVTDTQNITAAVVNALSFKISGISFNSSFLYTKRPTINA